MFHFFLRIYSVKIGVVCASLPFNPFEVCTAPLKPKVTFLTFWYVFWFSAPGLNSRTEPLPLKMSWKIPYRLSLLQTMLWCFICCEIILSVTNVPRSLSAWSRDALSQIYVKTVVVGVWNYVAIFNQILKFTSFLNFFLSVTSSAP